MGAPFPCGTAVSCPPDGEGVWARVRGTEHGASPVPIAVMGAAIGEFVGQTRDNKGDRTMAKNVTLVMVSASDVADAAKAYAVGAESALWQVYTVGYGIEFCSVAATVATAFMDKSMVSVGRAIARHADKDVKFRNRLVRGEFRSIRDAYNECPKKSGAGRPSATVADKAKKMVKEDKKSAVALAKAILAEAGIKSL